MFDSTLSRSTISSTDLHEKNCRFLKMNFIGYHLGGKKLAILEININFGSVLLLNKQSINNQNSIIL